MQVNTAGSKSKRTVTAIVAVPGPVTGMTVATQGVIDKLQSEGPVRIFHLGPRQRIAGWRWKLYKQWRVVLATRWLKKQIPANGEFLYLAANSNRGLSQTLQHVRIAKAAGFRIALHHHVFSYLSQRDERMAKIQELLDIHDVNILLSTEMREAFERQYQFKSSAIELNYAFMMRELLKSPIRLSPTVQRLGHLSNLTLEKGFNLVLETFDALRSSHEEVTLSLAGPLVSGRERTLLAAAIEKHPGLIDYCGPVFGEAKLQFLNDIDAFLMPTRYVNEAQPLVILEAFARGKPVIAYARGCIGSMFSGSEGRAIPPANDFIQPAVELIKHWRISPAIYQTAQLAARTRVEQMLVESLSALEQLAGWLLETNHCESLESLS